MVWRNLLAAVALLLALPALAAPVFPPLSGRVVDAANVIPEATEAALTEKLAGLETATGTQVVVATIPALNDVPVEDYGYQLGRAWGIGAKGRNNGAILIVAPADRKVRIEVGYGLEPVLTDALSSVIIQTAILPKFRAGDIPGGIVAGADAVVAQLSAAPEDAQAAVADAAARREARADAGAGPGPGALFFVAVVALFVIFALMRRGSGRGERRRGRSSGIGEAILWSMIAGGGRGGGGGFGGGGGGFSGGGGSFGGGGSSGSW